MKRKKYGVISFRLFVISLTNEREGERQGEPVSSARARGKSVRNTREVGLSP